MILFFQVSYHLFEKHKLQEDVFLCKCVGGIYLLYPMVLKCVNIYKVCQANIDTISKIELIYAAYIKSFNDRFSIDLIHFDFYLIFWGAFK